MLKTARLTLRKLWVRTKVLLVGYYSISEEDYCIITKKPDSFYGKPR